MICSKCSIDKPEPEYEYGEVTRYVEGFIKDIPIGAVATVAVGKYPIDKVQGACLNWFHKRHGAGSATTLPWRVVAVVPDTAYLSGSTVLYPEVLVKINNPQLTALTGVNYTA